MRTAFNRLTSSEKDIETIGKNQSTLGYEDILRLDPSGDDLEASRLIDSELLATVFDANGVVRFGKDAYKYALDKVYIIRNFEEAKLQGLGSIQEIVHLKRTTAHSKNARLADVSNECINNYRHGGYLKRLVADYTLNQPWGADGNLFNRVEAAAKHQRRVLGVWFADEIPSITLTTRGAYVGGDMNYGPYTNTNENMIPYSKDISTFGQLTASVSWLQVDAEGICDDGNFRPCTIRYN